MKKVKCASYRLTTMGVTSERLPFWLQIALIYKFRLGFEPEKQGIENK